MNRRAFITLLGGTGVARGGAGAGADDAAGWLPPRRRAHDLASTARRGLAESGYVEVFGVEVFGPGEGIPRSCVPPAWHPTAREFLPAFSRAVIRNYRHAAFRWERPSMS